MNRVDVIGGAVMILLGAGFAIYAWIDLPMGTMLRMGPGFMPMLLALVLVGLGAAVILQRPEVEAEPIHMLGLRTTGLIILSPLLFAATVKGIGLIGATFASTVVACFATTTMTIRRSMLVAISLAAFVTGVFYYGLAVPVPLIGDWIVR